MIKDKNNASFAYGMNLLKILLGMKLITEEEYGIAPPITMLKIYMSKIKTF